MRIVFLVLKIAVFLVLLSFAAKNLETVTLRYFLGLEWQVPVILLLLLFFGVGIATGFMASAVLIGRQKRELLALKRELRSRARLNVAAATAESI